MSNTLPTDLISSRDTAWANLRRAVLVALFVLALAGLGCAVGDGDEDEGGGGGGGDAGDGERTFSIGSSTDEGGTALATFELPSDTTKLSVTAFVQDSQEVRFTAFSDNLGTNYLDPSGDEITFGNSFTRGVNIVNAPSRAEDQPITGGQQFSVEVEVQGGRSQSSGSQVTFFINTKADSNLSAGQMQLNIFYVGEVGQDQDTRTIIASALEDFSEIYSSGASIGLTITEFNVEGPITLPAPFSGSQIYETASAEAPTPSVNLFVGGDIDDGSGAGGSPDLLGLAAGIPGPPVSSLRSAVAVGIFAAAGPDGQFSPDDVQVLGETMAHEVGHFMGLFHPVDFEGNVVNASDPLNDTPLCRFLTECLVEAELTMNLMFFTPISDGQGGFVRQNRLTADQRGVLNRYIVTD